MLYVHAFTFSPVQENTYIVYNNKGNAIIIDPGCYFAAEQETLQSFLTNNGLTVVQLINTHCHLDHVFGNKWAAETFNLSLYIHPQEEKMLAYAPQSGIKWGLPFDNYSGPLHFLKQDDIVQLDEDKMIVLETPGHSPGSLSFYAKNEQFVIAGDALFSGSIGRTDLPFANHEQLLSSIRTQLFTLPDAVKVYSGHGKPTTIGYEKLNNPYLKDS
ncbi:MAG: MBL fold metallo-hydrolase [Deinococcales bacterium]|nr:MBL fold metallo-hydrolase [Chitinophagaceae bacterium]